ncbi:transcription antitermination protein NusB [Staphylococcus gallinarum]|uniref:Transcription antitermination protein NusB n=1 Tax=Staphylococcus gallinarum TaxID=1293 RepID=A0A380FIP6_STAGA|nr:transcription antitermination protein NusB [Staphylococcus gallinarum]
MMNTDLSIDEAISFIKDDNPDLEFEFINWLVSGVKDQRKCIGPTDTTAFKRLEIRKIT